MVLGSLGGVQVGEDLRLKTEDKRPDGEALGRLMGFAWAEGAYWRIMVVVKTMNKSQEVAFFTLPP